MATYNELHALRGVDVLTSTRQKLAIAIAIKANAITKLPTPTDAQKTFARAALSNPESYVDTVLNYVLAEFNTSATTAITGATDAQVQTAVNNAVDNLLGV